MKKKIEPGFKVHAQTWFTIRDVIRMLVLGLVSLLVFYAKRYDSTMQDHTNQLNQIALSQSQILDKFDNISTEVTQNREDIKALQTNTITNSTDIKVLYARLGQ